MPVLLPALWPIASVPRPVAVSPIQLLNTDVLVASMTRTAWSVPTIRLPATSVLSAAPSSWFAVTSTPLASLPITARPDGSLPM